MASIPAERTRHVIAISKAMEIVRVNWNHWNVMARYGMARHGTYERDGTAWYDVTRYGTVRYGTARHL